MWLLNSWPLYITLLTNIKRHDEANKFHMFWQFSRILSISGDIISSALFLLDGAWAGIEYSLSIPELTLAQGHLLQYAQKLNDE